MFYNSQLLTQSRLFDRVADMLLAEVVQTRRCPLQCVVACILSLITDCGHNLGGLQPNDDCESSGESPVYHMQEQATQNAVIGPPQ